MLEYLYILNKELLYIQINKKLSTLIALLSYIMLITLYICG
jgi:hypothetical protein